MSVAVDLEGAVEMGTLLYRALATVFNHPAPENGLTFVVRSLQFEPRVVSVDGAAGKEVADLFRANHDVNTHGVATPHDRLHAVKWRCDRGGFARARRRDLCLRFFTYRERGCQLMLSGGTGLQFSGGRRHRKN